MSIPKRSISSAERLDPVKSLLSIWRFYCHLYACSPMLTLGSIGINFIAPFAIIRYCRSLSPLSLARNIRSDKIDIKHRLIRGKNVSTGSLLSLIAISMLYTVIQSLHQSIRNKFALLTRIILHRRIIGNLLYCDLDQLNNHSVQSSNHSRNDSNHHNTEKKSRSNYAVNLFEDIDATVTFHQITVPAMLQSMIDCSITMHELYMQRLRIDVLAVVRPIVIATIDYLINAPIDHSVGMSINRLVGVKPLDAISVASERQVFCNVVEHLGEIQANNQQRSQLSRFNLLTRASMNQSPSRPHFATTSDAARLNDQPYQVQAALDFVSETVIIRAAMANKGLSHRKYMRIHADIDFAMGLFQSIYSLFGECAHVIQSQSHKRVVAALEARAIGSFDRSHLVSSSGLYKSSGHNGSKRRLSRVRFNIDGEVAEPIPFTPEHTQTLPDINNLPAIAKLDELSSAFSSLEAPTDPINFHSIVLRRLRYQHSFGEHDGSLRIDTDHDSGEPVVFRRGKMYLILGDECRSMSSFMRILARVTRPELQDCDLSVDGRPFHTIHPASWQHSTCYLSSQPFIFAGTVEDNIRCGNAELTAADLLRAATAAGLLEIDPHIARHDHVGSDTRPVHLVQHAQLYAQHIMYRSYHVIEQQLTSISRFIQSYTLPARPANNKFLARVTNKFLGLPTGSSTQLIDVVSQAGQQTLSNHPILSMSVHEGGTNVSSSFAQALVLARLLVRDDVNCVLIDDGLNGINQSIRRDVIYPALVALAHRKHITVIMTSQNLVDVSTYVDYVYVMDKGRISDQGLPEQLIEQLTRTNRAL